MSAAPANTEESTFLVRYDVSDAWIAEMKARCADLAFDTPAQYRESTKALQVVRETRTSVEKRRVDLKRDILAAGRLVDSEAKRITALLLEIETPLKAKKDAVDDEKARQKREEEEARLWAERELEAQRQAEEKKKADEAARIERERLAAERAEFEAQKAAAAKEREQAEAAARLERQKLEAERAALEAEKRLIREAEERAARIEAEKVARLKAEAEAKERAERERIEAEKRAAEEAARLERLRPDLVRVGQFGERIRALAGERPDVSSREAIEAVSAAVVALDQIANRLLAFGGKP